MDVFVTYLIKKKTRKPIHNLLYLGTNYRVIDRKTYYIGMRNEYHLLFEVCQKVFQIKI